MTDTQKNIINAEEIGYMSYNKLNMFMTILLLGFSITFAILGDRVNISNNPSGVLCKVAEIVHPALGQTGLLGSGSTSWQTVNGSGSIMNLTFESTGYSGIAPSGNSTVDTRMDYYLAISASPSSVGSKTFAGYFSVEYL